eukprot:9032130-Alexandrium_andersonii.AAC.1
MGGPSQAPSGGRGVQGAWVEKAGRKTIPGAGVALRPLASANALEESMHARANTHPTEDPGPEHSHA